MKCNKCGEELYLHCRECNEWIWTEEQAKEYIKEIVEMVAEGDDFPMVTCKECNAS